MTTPTVGKRSNQKNPQASHFRISSRSMTWSFWRRASSFIDSPRLRLRLARPRSQTRLACGCGSHGHVHRLASPAAAARTAAPRRPAARTATTGPCRPSSVPSQNVVTATAAISREANRMRGLESLPSIVRQDDPEKVLGAGAEPERDEGMIAERRGQREAADLRGSVEDGHPVQIERLPGLGELPLPDLQPRSARVLDLDLDIDDLAGADAALGDQLRDPDRRRAELVGSHAARRRRGAGAPPGAVGDRDGPRGLPAGVAAAFGRRRALGGPVSQPDLEGDGHLTVPRREVEYTLQRNGIALVYDAEARDVVAGVHRVGHLHRERDLGPAAGERGQPERRWIRTLGRRARIAIVATLRGLGAPEDGPNPSHRDQPHGRWHRAEKPAPGQPSRP